MWIAPVNLDVGLVTEWTTERPDVFRAQRAGASGFNLPLPSLGDATPENIVLAPAIDADDRPHVMIVRHDSHVRRPYHVEDAQVRRAVDLLETRAVRLAQRLEQAGRVRYRPFDDLADGL